jgi:membrane associated rhomboid family serine protease
MIPIADANTTRRFPIMTWTLIGINVVVFLYELSLNSRQLNQLISTWGAVPANILFALSNPAETPLQIWATLITAQFLHAGWLHIIGNMLFLWVFGDNIEDVLGHIAYVFFYLISGGLAMIVQSVVSGPVNIPSVGASGAIAGVLGAYVLLYPWNRIRILLPFVFLFWTAEIPAIFVIGWWFIQQFFYGLGILTDAAAGGVAFWAHIGGFIAGMLIILPFLGRAHRRRRPARYYYNVPDDYYPR